MDYQGNELVVGMPGEAGMSVLVPLQCSAFDLGVVKW